MKSLVATFLLSAIAVGGFAVPASASSGENAGQIDNIFSFGTSGAMDFQVTIKGLSTLCPGHDFAYINTTDNNYATITANVLQARYYGSNLYIYWTTDANSDCHITRVYY